MIIIKRHALLTIVNAQVCALLIKIVISIQQAYIVLCKQLLLGTDCGKIMLHECRAYYV